MITNYLKSAWRHIVKHKGFSVINIFSLAIGLAAAMVIFLFVTDELSFDAVHQKNIYRLCEVQSFPGTNVQKVALSMPGMGPTLTEEFPEIEQYTRFWSWGEQLLKLGDKRLMADKVVGVDTAFFEMFDFAMISGDPRTVVDRPYDAVISAEYALKLFDRLDVVGESFYVDDDQCTVRGVMENVPENSHLQFDIALAISTVTKDRENFDGQFGSNFLNTYLILHPEADLDNMATRYPAYIARYGGGEDANDYYKLFLQPLRDVHLTSMDIEHDYNNHRKFNGQYIGIFILIGVFILIIAGVNFMNLSTARAGNRAKEVGIRKTIGAAKGQLFQQFVVESILMSLLALVLALAIVLITLPFLNALIDRQLNLLVLFSNPVIDILALILTLILGILAGLYPSLYLSSFKPVIVLKGLKILEKRSIFRSTLVIVQFSLALGMIVSTLIVVQQLIFMKNKDIGFEKDHILLVDMNEEVQENYASMKQELLKSSHVLGVTASGQRIGNNFHQWGFKVKKDTGIVSITPSNVLVDFDYLEVYGIKLLKGRSFSKDYATDDGLAFIINESFAKELGFDDPIGKKAGHNWYPDDSLGTIIGVTEDFNFNSLHYRVNTLSMVVHEGWGYSEMSVKLNGETLEQALKDVENVYDQFVTDYPIRYEFLDKHFEELYQSDQQMGSVITIMAVLSIFIGCMGLFGLASIAVQRRIKEIGIRKVMGASEGQLLRLLSENFAKLILISFLIATPLTYLFLQGWLENFAYRIELNPLVFLVGGLLAMIIALATISFHVVKAATANPVNALRYE